MHMAACDWCWRSRRRRKRPLYTHTRAHTRTHTHTHTHTHGILCMVLALKEATQTPFLALDEFDVFMDERNRKVSLMTLCQVCVCVCVYVCMYVCMDGWMVR